MYNYNIKVDDSLLYFLKEYHNIDVSEAMLFFDDRVKDMGECEPNITEKSRRSELKFNPLDGRTVQKKWGGRKYGEQDRCTKFYVLRGFYPNTNIPFKITAVYSNNDTPYHKSANPNEPIRPIHVKVIMGMKPHWSFISSGDVNKYREHACEAMLLEQEPMEEQKIKYKYRNFKCMRPKGMELYHERNHEDKQRELRRVRAAERRKGKGKDELASI